MGRGRQARAAAGGPRGRWALLCLLSALVAVALALPGGARADLRFCPPGEEAGQCDEQAGVATDFEEERLYVADKANNRIDVFAVDGSFLFAFGWKVDKSAPAEELQTCTTISGCQKGSAGTGDGQLSKPRRVAVDNGPSASHHDVYVFDSGNLRVQKFSPAGAFLKKAGSEGTGPGQFNDEVDLLAVAPSGEVYVSDMPKFAEEPRIEVFDGELALLEEFEPAHEDRLNTGLAVDSAGAAYAVFNTSPDIFKFEPGGAEAGAPYPLQTTETRALAIGAQEQLFAAQREDRASKPGEVGTITEYAPAGGILERFGYGIGLIGTGGIAVVHSEAPAPLRSGDAFASLASGPNRIAYAPMPPPGPVVAPLSLEAEEGNTKATLAGELNPEGAKPTEYHFDYVDQHSFETEGGFESPNTEQTPTEEVAIATGTPAEEEKDLFSLHAAEAQIGCADPLSEAGHPGETAIEAGECLLPETAYRFRLVASNAEGEASGEIDPVEGSFETKPGLEITETWASEPTTTGARLNARVDPLGIPASGYFEYVGEGAFQESGFEEAKQLPDVAHGAGPLDFGSGEAQVRSVLLNGLTPGGSYRFRLVADDPLLEAPIEGPTRTLRPFAKPGQGPCPNDALRPGAGAQLADCRAYEMVSPLDKNNGDIVPLGEFQTDVPAALDQSAASGEKVTYTSSTAFGDAASAPLSSEYLAERGEGEWESHAINSPRGKLDLPAAPQFNTEFKRFSADLCQAWQRTVAEPPLSAEAIAAYPNLYRRTDQSCGGAPDYEALSTVAPPNVGGEQYYPLELQGASAEGSAAVFVAPDNLAAGAPAQPASCVAEGTGCQLRLYEKRPGQGPKFVCYLPGGEAVGPCEAGSGSGGSGGQSFSGSLQNAISADGEEIYWSAGGKIYVRVGGTQTVAVSEAAEAISGTSSSRFLAASADGRRAVFLSGEDLYLYEWEGDQTTPIADKSVGLAGMSEDGSRVYFGSTEAVPGVGPNSEGDLPEAGRPNLYLHEAGGTRFVATLASGEQSARFSALNGVPIQHMARVSGDGGALAFITAAAPTHYDNTDASSPEQCGEGHPEGLCDAELYLYRADAGEGEGLLACVSCNPSGARPAGADISERIHVGTHESFFAAGWIPAWENNQYASRALSANGRRLFFEAADALSPLDSNGKGDVYEWEAAGEGTCKSSAPSYAPASGGCVDLVSAGKSGRDSLLLDADPSGKNAFFTTLSSLVPQDYGLVDVYDARAGGGFPPPPSPRVECEGEACQSPPGPPGETTPASAAFGGEEAPEGKKKACPKGKRRVRRHGKARCVKRHRHQGHRHHKRRRRSSR
jgi:hypothetical protein